MTASPEAARAPSGAANRAPDFYIVGNPKSGTTALYEMLRGHPRIYMPDLKEPWYFASDMQPRFQPARAGATPRTLENYLELFTDATPDQRVGEASSSYLCSTTAAARIAEVRPDARIIAILREPASFLHSLHAQLLRDHIESEKTLSAALALESDRRAGRNVPRDSHIPQLLAYSEHVRYVEQLRRYHASFPAEQVLVLIYEDFRADNEAAVRCVQRFLGVDERAPLEVSEANRTDARMRSQRLDNLVNAVSVGRGPLARAAKAAAMRVFSQRLRRGAISVTQRHLVNTKANPPDERLMLALRRRFEGEVVALSEYLDRDLVTLWGYDRLD
jgi:hypothetical protein